MGDHKKPCVWELKALLEREPLSRVAATFSVFWGFLILLRWKASLMDPSVSDFCDERTTQLWSHPDGVAGPAILVLRVDLYSISLVYSKLFIFWIWRKSAHRKTLRCFTFTSSLPWDNTKIQEVSVVLLLAKPWRLEDYLTQHFDSIIIFMFWLSIASLQASSAWQL